MALIGIFGKDPNGDSLNEGARSYFGIDKPVEVINISDNAGFDAILGMDVLENYTFTFANSGDFELYLQ